MVDGPTDQSARRTGPGPLRHFLAQLDELRSCDVLDMDQVGRLLVELAATKNISVR